MAKWNLNDPSDAPVPSVTGSQSQMKSGFISYDRSIWKQLFTTHYTVPGNTMSGRYNDPRSHILQEFPKGYLTDQPQRRGMSKDNLLDHVNFYEACRAMGKIEIDLLVLDSIPTTIGDALIYLKKHYRDESEPNLKDPNRFNKHDWVQPIPNGKPARTVPDELKTAGLRKKKT